MRQFILYFVVIGFLIIMTPILSYAQLFETKELYTNTNVIKGKYFNESGGGRYWSLEYVDSIGRIINKESYYKKRLLSKQKLIYDNYNNLIFSIQTFDYNNPQRIDTLKYSYNYANNQITYQSRKLSNNDSTSIKLIENQGDTILKYREQAFYSKPNAKNMAIYETAYTLKYKDGYLVSEEKFDKQQNSTEIKKYEYFVNGRLKRRSIKRIPEPKIKNHYSGGPRSDDEFYKYKFNSKGKIRILYKIINGKKYKIAVYSYE